MMYPIHSRRGLYRRLMAASVLWALIVIVGPLHGFTSAVNALHTVYQATQVHVVRITTTTTIHT